MRSANLTAIYVKGEFGYTAYIDEMRGVMTQGETLESAESNLFEALETYLEPDEILEPTDLEPHVPVIRKNFASLVKHI